MRHLANRKIALRSHAGISLVEVLVAITILTFAVLPLINAVLVAKKQVTDAEKTNINLLLAQDLLSLIKSKKWDEQADDLANFVATPSSLGLDAGETALSDFDDIDDFNGYTDHPRSYLERAVQVDYVDFDTNGNVVPALGPTSNHKRVIVTLTMTSGSSQPQSVQGIFTNGFRRQ